ncbi:hypothetical protein ACFVFJ_17355 [Streptomyces sp. NPDC057717]
MQAIVDWSCGVLLADIAIVCDERDAVNEIDREIAQIAGQA